MDGLLACRAYGDLRLIEKHQVVVLEENGQLVGFYGVEFRTELAHLEHLWVEPIRIGSGLGWALFTQACSEARANGYIALEWVADPNAEGFYRSSGSVCCGASSRRCSRHTESATQDAI